MAFVEMSKNDYLYVVGVARVTSNMSSFMNKNNKSATTKAVAH